MSDQLKKYLASFLKLRIDRAHGTAPHKSILLLSVLQAYLNGSISNSRIYITPELVALFKTNWSQLVSSNHTCQFALPFYHLTSDKFWKLIPKQGFENILQFKSSMRSFTNLYAAIDYALIDDSLFLLMQDPTSNRVLQQFLLGEYFPYTKRVFTYSTVCQQKIYDDIKGKILNEDPAEYRKEIRTLFKQQNEEEIYLRGSIFKREVPKIYNYTCCISGMKIDTIYSVSMVDACHIVPFSESYDDTITNGISLCPNLHRAFDRGLISVDENYKVLVNPNWNEKLSHYSIKQFEGIQILLPTNPGQLPLPENFQNHRKRFGFQGT